MDKKLELKLCSYGNFEHLMQSFTKPPSVVHYAEIGASFQQNPIWSIVTSRPNTNCDGVCC